MKRLDFTFFTKTKDNLTGEIWFNNVQIGTFNYTHSVRDVLYGQPEYCPVKMPQAEKIRDFLNAIWQSLQGNTYLWVDFND